jgi:hypothetical protein
MRERPVGFLDKAKKQLTKAVDQHGDKIAQGADKLGDTINQKTGNKHADKIAQGKVQLKKGLDSLDGKNDDFGKPRP